MTIDVLLLGVISGLRPATSQAALVALLARPTRGARCSSSSWRGSRRAC